MSPLIPFITGNKNINTSPQKLNTLKLLEEENLKPKKLLAEKDLQI